MFHSKSKYLVQCPILKPDIIVIHLEIYCVWVVFNRMKLSYAPYWFLIVWTFHHFTPIIHKTQFVSNVVRVFLVSGIVPKMDFICQFGFNYMGHQKFKKPPTTTGDAYDIFYSVRRNKFI